MRVTLIIFTILTAFAGAARAQESEPSEAMKIARAYLDAYQALDMAAMESLLAEDAVFTDRGSFEIEGGPYHYEGREAILSALTSFRNDYGLYAVTYDLDQAYESSGQAVFAGAVEARWRQADGRDQVWRSYVVTGVRVRDGEVVEHLDLPDYRRGVVTTE